MSWPTAMIEAVDVSAYDIPTDMPESDGTLEWSSTGLVCVWVRAGGLTGFGYTYAGPAPTASVVGTVLKDVLIGSNPFDIPAILKTMWDAVRNIGRPGIASLAISAVDIALWDLKARLMDVSMMQLLGRARARIRAYGSGGFTSYTPDQLATQLGTWAGDGFFAVKMKVGRVPAADTDRVKTAREAIGDDCELFVDANGAYSVKQSLGLACEFSKQNVSWLEEPVSSDDLTGLRRICEHGPAGMAITAGEYGFSPWYFRRMLAAGAVDTLQADITRCGGFTGFMAVAALAEAFHTPLSSHCAPALHVHACCAARPAIHLEWFHDHCRIENHLMQGAPKAENGWVVPPSGPGHGLQFNVQDAARYLI